jgi:hypothetical protein
MNFKTFCLYETDKVAVSAQIFDDTEFSMNNFMCWKKPAIHNSQ